MTYSRWSNGSGWYCYWSDKSPKTKFRLPTQMLKNRQVFEIFDSPRYFITYGKIKDKGISKVIDEIRLFYKQKRLSEERMMIMMNCINMFVEDVDNHFKLITFFKHEWIYPIFKNK